MKVLITRFSSIGDIVLTTPVVRALRRQAGAEVHFLTKRGYAGVLGHNPHLHRLWAIEKDVQEVAGALAAERFDHFVDLHGNLRTQELRARLALAGSRPTYHAFDKLNLQKFLLTRFGIDRLPDLHIVDRYLAAAAPLGVEADGEGLDYYIDPAQRVDLASAGLPTDYLALVVGAAHATKRLEEDQLRTLCELLTVPVVLLGGPGDREAGARIADGLGHVFDTCGRYSLDGSADLVKKSRAVVTHDTGLMHVAAAFRKPMLSVWGNTVPAFGMYPYLPGAETTERERRAEVNDLGCRPCSKIGHARCPKGHFRCMRDQDVASIARRAEALVTGSPRNGG